MRYAIDSSKIVKDIGWYSETDFETGIRKTIKWYLENQEWVNEFYRKIHLQKIFIANSFFYYKYYF